MDVTSHVSNIHTHCEDNMVEMLIEMAPNQVSPSKLPLDHDYIARPIATSIVIRKAQSAPTPPPPTTAPSIRKTAGGNYKCTLCGYTTNSKMVIDKHERVHRSLKPGQRVTKCTSCDINGGARSGYIKCPKCNFFTTKEHSLRIHMRIHDKARPYRCTDCKYLAVDLEELVEHYKLGHEKVYKYVCGVCEYSTHIKERYNSHCRTHTGEKPNKCSLCDFATNDRGNLSKHMKKHNS